MCSLSQCPYFVVVLCSVHLLLLCRKEEPDAKKAKVDEEEDYNLAEISEGNVTSVSHQICVNVNTYICTLKTIHIITYV